MSTPSDGLDGVLMGQLRILLRMCEKMGELTAEKEKNGRGGNC